MFLTARKTSPIEDFDVTYEALNKKDTFSEGDTVAGAVTFTLTKDTKVKSVFVKVTGDANVCWEEQEGETHRTGHKRYFKVKEYLVANKIKGTVLHQGNHHFKFRLQIPQRDMPSSFDGSHGRIVYFLEAKILRNCHRRCARFRRLRFVSKSVSQHGQVMSGSVGEEFAIFSKGQVQMSATINRKVCCQGGTFSVVTKIHNSSSTKMKPSLRLIQKAEYRAGETKVTEEFRLNVAVDTVTLNSMETISHVKIPAFATPTVHNCKIISVDYYLRVSLDSSSAEVTFPLVILPSCFAAILPGEDIVPGPAGAVGGPSNSNLPPPATLPPPAILPPPAVLPPPAILPPPAVLPPPAISSGACAMPTAPGVSGRQFRRGKASTSRHSL